MVNSFWGAAKLALFILAGLGAAGLALAELGQLAYTDAAYIAAENMLAAAALLALALVVMPAIQPSDPPAPPAPGGRPAVDRRVLAVAGLALGLAAGLRLAAPGSAPTLAIGLAALFIAPGGALVQSLFPGLAWPWRLALTPAISVAALLILIGWVLRLGVPLTPASILACAVIATALSFAAPALLRRLRLDAEPA